MTSTLSALSPAVGDPGLDALLDQAATRAEIEAAEDRAVLAEWEAISPMLPWLWHVGGTEGARRLYAFDHTPHVPDWLPLDTLDEAGNAVCRVGTFRLGPAPRPPVEAGSLAAVRIKPIPLQEDLDGIEAADRWNAVQSLSLRWQGRSTSAAKHAREEFKWGLAMWLDGLFEALRVARRSHPATAG